MKISHFTHPAPLPGRSYWVLVNEVKETVFSLGEQDVIVEGVLTGVEEAHLRPWIFEAARLLEWPQETMEAGYEVVEPPP